MNENERAAPPLLGGLHDLKEWLTLGEAAKLLAQFLNDEVSEADLLRLGLDGRLVLSARFVNMATAKPGRLVAQAQAIYKVVPGLEGETVRLYGGPVIDNGDVIELDRHIVHLNGVFDLPMFAVATRLCVERLLQAHLHEHQVEVTDLPFDGVFVSRGETYFLLQDYKQADPPQKTPEGKWQLRTGTHHERYELPDDAPIVVRPAALRRLLGELAESGEPPSLPAPCWPWGTHETELLRHLAAAGRKWWANFDPADNTTAPTNEQVSTWLQKRGVAARTAEVMASILRADDLPTGPRR